MKSCKYFQTGHLVFLVKVTWYQDTTLEIEDVSVLGSEISKYETEK
jgi:hypothetical protein